MTNGDATAFCQNCRHHSEAAKTARRPLAILNGTHHWSTGCCTRCGIAGGRAEWGTPTAGWIEHEDRHVRLCPNCCTLDEYRLAVQPFVDAMDRARERGSNLPDWLIGEAGCTRRYISALEPEENELRALVG